MRTAASRAITSSAAASALRLVVSMRISGFSGV